MSVAMVIGVGGVGSVIGMKLHECDCFEKIILADMEPTFAERLRQRTKQSRFIVCQANASDTAKLIELERFTFALHNHNGHETNRGYRVE